MTSSKIRWARLGTLAAAGATVAALAAGCSGKTTTQGEIVVAVQTDLSLPKDVSQVRIQITTLGVVRFDNTYPVGPDPSMRIPATIGLLPGENPDAPIRIRIVGFKKENQPRILREVVTTVPPSRVVSLRMPLQWISDGSALAQPLGNSSTTASAGFVTARDATDPFAFYNRCPDGQTDIGGECVSSAVDSSTLPEYSPGDVFGGGGEDGAGGTCFDTQPCMAGGVIQLPTLEADGTCALAAPAGDPSLVNVAIEFGANGDGVCADAAGSAPCFVPLDRVDESAKNLGWTPGNETPPVTAGGGGGGTGADDAGTTVPSADGGGPAADAGLKLQSGDTPTAGDATPFTTIHLPAAICRKLTAQGFTGHVVISTSCASKTPKNPTCGPWSSVSSSGGTGGADGGTTVRPDGSVGDNCTPTCGGSGSSGGSQSCGCTETCQGHTYTIACAQTVDSTNCSCAVDGLPGQAATAAGVTCGDQTSLLNELAACKGSGPFTDASAGQLTMVPAQMVLQPQATQQFVVLQGSTPVPDTSITWQLDGTLGTSGGFMDQVTPGLFHAGNSGSGHVIGMVQGQGQAMAQVDVAPGGADSGTPVSCPTPTCNISGGDGGDAGPAMCTCSALCSDGQTHVMSCTGTQCACTPTGKMFAQGGACTDAPTAETVFVSCQ